MHRSDWSVSGRIRASLKPVRVRPDPCIPLNSQSQARSEHLTEQFGQSCMCELLGSVQVWPHPCIVQTSQSQAGSVLFSTCPIKAASSRVSTSPTQPGAVHLSYPSESGRFRASLEPTTLGPVRVRQDPFAAQTSPSQTASVQLSSSQPSSQHL